MRSSAKSLVDAWVDDPPPAWDDYWGQIHFVAKQLKSDGCTCVSDIFIDACYEHDIHWRLGATIFNEPLTTAQANRRFRKVIQSRSPLGRFSPTSWVRWLGVTVGAHFIDHQTT